MHLKEGEVFKMAASGQYKSIWAGKIKLSSNLCRFVLKQVFANQEAFLGLVTDGDAGDR